MASATSTKRAAYAVLEFLEQSTKNGAVRSEDAEGLEVALQCISEAFGVSTESEQDKKAYGVTKSLPAILDEVATATPAASAAKEPSASDKEEAEKAKVLGNQLMAKKDFAGSIEAYSDAIEKDGTNPVYWSNRAAAYSSTQDYQSAVSDARRALDIDPSFSKAYSRLGHALFSIGEYEQAVEAYEKGLELDPNNATMKSSLNTARSKVPKAEGENSASVSRNETPAGGARGAGAGGMPGFPGMGGAGGMPDLSSMMNNPAYVPPSFNYVMNSFN
ncbi:hypothetical protein JCM11251_006465 [Rhodosporidiobolus azoricus]